MMNLGVEVSVPKLDGGAMKTRVCCVTAYETLMRLLADHLRLSLERTLYRHSVHERLPGQKSHLQRKPCLAKQGLPSDMTEVATAISQTAARAAEPHLLSKNHGSVTKSGRG